MIADVYSLSTLNISSAQLTRLLEGFNEWPIPWKSTGPWSIFIEK